MKDLAVNEFDVLLIGAGQAAIPLARRLAKSGRRVAIAERRHLGGSCVNFGCTPTKAVLASARVAHLARRAAEFGVTVPNVAIDFPGVLGRARAIVDEAKASLAKGLADSGVEVIGGHARFVERDGDVFRLDVDGRTVVAPQVVIDTGTRTKLPPIEGLADVPYLHAGNWLDSDDLPEHVAFIGAGTIALEMAQFYCRMGARVDVFDPNDVVAGHEDRDVSIALRDALEGEGVRFRLNTRIDAATRDGPGVRLRFDEGGQNASAVFSHLFIATGRQPSTDELGLETIGLSTKDDGTLEVDERLSTRVPGVWACGDVRGGPMFTHAAWDDHRVLESQLLGDGERTIGGRVVPYAIFTDPELGRVGMTEREAREKHGDHVKVARFDMRHNGKATQAGEPGGFIKLIADTRTDELLGAAVFATDGAELVGSYITLMNARATLAAICRGIYIHPTLTEAVQSAVMALELGLHPDATER